MTALGAADAAVLALAVPSPRRLATGLRAPEAWVGRDRADGVAAQLGSALLWCLAAYVALALLAVLARTLPGTAGRAADVLAHVVLPRALYRAAAGAAGLGVVLAPAAAGADAPRVPVSATTAAPVWPSDAPLPAPAWPVDPVRHAPVHGSPDPRISHDPAVAPAPQTVVVRPGDSLWAIAAAHLPASAGADRVARAWPRWYGANRAVIGDDPGLLHPGQVLQVPAGMP